MEEKRPTNNHIGKNIRKARKSRGYTMEDLAGMAGIGRRTLDKIENGQSDPKVSTIEKIRKILDVSCHAIFDDNSEESD